MSLSQVLNISSSGMSAESIRLNTIASNLSNANSEASTEADAYHARKPVFNAVYDRLLYGDVGGGVGVSEVATSDVPVIKQYQPGNPMANEEGYIYTSNVNTVEEMADMISASRSYQNQVEVFQTAKQLLLQTLNLGQ